MDDKYHITLLARVGTQERNLDDSQGLETVKNFSFIAGLVDVARKNLNSKSSSRNEEGMVVTEPYPLVMDAPFSNADETHIENISKILPTIAEQIIIILMNKDWEYAKSALSSRVGKYYIIEKSDDSETQSTLREGV
jgi:DNA sulfur modification protein DndD